MKDRIIAIDLGGTTAKLAIIRVDGAIEHEWIVDTDKSNQGSQIVPNLIDSIRSTLSELDIHSQDLLGIGMGSPGTVSSQDETVIGAYNLNWKNRQEVGAQFRGAFQLPFAIANDADVAALGEQWLGAGDQVQDLVMVTLGTGVGGGVIVDGKIVEGSSGGAGEIGHITILPDSPITCTCGKAGCLEALASSTGLINLVHHYQASYEGESEFCQLVRDNQMIEAKDVFEAAKAGDPFAVEMVDLYSYYLGLAISHIINILNPAIVVLGGGVSNAGDFLLDKVKENCYPYVFEPLRAATSVRLAELGNQAGVLGAAQLINQLVTEEGRRI
ncbi:ROK family glucokinase [Hutsoniella sourekii]